MEEFRDVIGYEDLFQVSNIGRVLSKRTNKILKQVVSKTGYYIFATKIGGRSGKDVCFKVHRLVAQAFIPNELAKPQVNHKDGDKLNNSVDNLEWATASENVKHAFRTGLASNKKSVDSLLSKLTRQDVDYIKLVYIPRSKEFGARALGRKLGVCHSTIMRAFNSVLSAPDN